MKADLDTCWNSKFQVFDSIIYQWHRILEFLVEGKQEKLIYWVGKKIVKDFIDFLTPLNDLETSKVATSCLI